MAALNHCLVWEGELVLAPTKETGWEGLKSRMIREPENLIASAYCDRSSEGRYKRQELH